MSALRTWLLIGALACLAGCQSAPQAKPLSQGAPLPVLTIDFVTGEARTSAWTKPVTNCSDDAHNCLIVYGVFSASFPKRCTDFPKSAAWDSPAGKIRVVALEPHYGFPFGSYISENYPNALLLYRGGIGLDELRTTNATPFQSDFDPNAYSQSYRIIFVGKKGAFLCSQPQ